MPAYFGAKQPWEEYFVKFDFANYLGDEAISTATVSVVDTATDEDATDTVTDVAQQTYDTDSVYVWVQAGEAGSDYQITCRLEGASGSKYELDGVLPVRER